MGNFLTAVPLDEELCLRRFPAAARPRRSQPHRYTALCAAARCMAYFLAGGDSEEICCRRMLGLLKAIRSMTPGATRPFRTFADTCIRNRLCTALRALRRSIRRSTIRSHHPAFFGANTAFAQVDPEVLLIDREKTANLLDSAHKLLSEFEVKVLQGSIWTA